MKLEVDKQIRLEITNDESRTLTLWAVVTRVGENDQWLKINDYLILPDNKEN